MQIFVRSNAKTFEVTLQEDATLRDLKAAIADVEFIPADIISVSKGDETLACGSLYGVVGDMDTVTMIIDVNGGMRAKWRKKRMRRLRRKRRKMRMRAK